MDADVADARLRSRLHWRMVGDHQPIARTVGLALVVAAYVVHRVLVVLTQLRIHAGSSDVSRFFEIATHPGVPYRDFAVEYPPLTVALVKLLSWLAPTRSGFETAVAVTAIVCEITVVGLLWRGWGWRVAMAFAVLDSALIHILVLRLDLVVTAMAVAAALNWKRNRPATTGLLVVGAVATKLWPIALAPFFLRSFTGRARARFAVYASVSGAVLAAVWLGLGGLSGLRQVLSFRGAQGWQVESVVGVLVRGVTQEPAVEAAGAHRFGRVPFGLALALAVVGLALAIWVGWHGASRDDIVDVWLAGVGTLLLTSTLFSPQFVVWILPAAAASTVHRGLVLPGLAVAVTALTLLESWLYGGVLTLQPVATGAVVARNAALLALVAVAMRRLVAIKADKDAGASARS